MITGKDRSYRRDVRRSVITAILHSARGQLHFTAAPFIRNFTVSCSRTGAFEVSSARHALGRFGNKAPNSMPFRIPLKRLLHYESSDSAEGYNLPVSARWRK
jgi:hypothetical protein